MMLQWGGVWVTPKIKLLFTYATLEFCQTIETKVCIKNFLKDLKEIGYERLSSHHQATNRAILITKLKFGFVIAGVELTERWGVLVKVIKLLRKDRRESFYKQFGLIEHMIDHTD